MLKLICGQRDRVNSGYVIANALCWAAMMFVVPSLPIANNRWTTIGLLVAGWFATHSFISKVNQDEN